MEKATKIDDIIMRKEHPSTKIVLENIERLWQIINY